MDDLPRNEYLREMDLWKNRTFSQPRIENGILLTPDGLRWRIEDKPLGDILHVGDSIRTSYSTGGIIVELNRRKTCCCPYRGISRDKYCYPSWDEPGVTMQYHVDVYVWNIGYVHPEDIRVTKKGILHDGQRECYLNGYVWFGGRILSLFENNDDEIFIQENPIRAAPTFQMALL